MFLADTNHEERLRSGQNPKRQTCMTEYKPVSFGTRPPMADKFQIRSKIRSQRSNKTAIVRTAEKWESNSEMKLKSQQPQH
jgi:hypothetical protein